MGGLRGVTREETESKSLASFNFATHKIAIAYAASNELRLGLLREISGSGDAESTWALAAEYFHSKDLWVKGRITSQGVLSLFKRYILNPQWTVESHVETGLDSKHRIKGIAGSNLFAGVKLIYNE